MSSPNSSASPSPLIVGNVARPLLGKVALVTGASRGIGAAIARVFAAAGADVAISYSASKDKADEVVAAIKATGQRGLAVKADHSVQSEVVALVNTVAKEFGKGRLDILVNNAGVFIAGAATDPKSSTDEQVAAFNRQFAINVQSVATAVRTAAQYLPEGGRIISVGSGLAQVVPFPGVADYSATKAALIAYTKGWARDFGSKNVTVNLVQPGHTDTEMNPASGPLSAVSKGTPAGRHGTPEEIAAAVLFLATPAASFVNAAILTVDGGCNA